MCWGVRTSGRAGRDGGPDSEELTVLYAVIMPPAQGLSLSTIVSRF